MPTRLSKRALDVRTVAALINWPVEGWPGHCYQVASQVFRSELLPARSQLSYGIWHGPIAEGNIFTGRPFSNHGWIDLPDGRVYDPTRWVFESAAPYIYVGRSDHYDFGGNALRQALFRQGLKPPVAKPDDPRKPLKVAHDLRKVLNDVLQLPASHPASYTVDQVHWLAHIDPVQVAHLKAGARRLYQAIVDAGHGALIPMDNRNRFLGD